MDHCPVPSRPPHAPDPPLSGTSKSQFFATPSLSQWCRPPPPSEDGIAQPFLPLEAAGPSVFGPRLATLA